MTNEAGLRQGMFKITDQTIEPRELSARLADRRAGALATFEGWVRDHNEGQRVTALEYEAYAALAEKEGARVISEARERFEMLDAVCVHRVGRLGLGEIAVWVGVTAAHRDAAFAACQYIIDEVKARVPIWKKEFYADGDSGWVNCPRCSAPDHHHGHGNGHGVAAKEAPEARYHPQAHAHRHTHQHHH
jgi:molybdopterin synthase catalytic subunit